MLNRRRTVRTAVLLTLSLHLGAGAARAQAPYQLVAALTDQTPVTVSDLQGIPAAVTANDAGDVAWLGQRFAAVFYRRAGAPQAVRVIQLGDEVAGLPGSRVLNVFVPLLMNSAGRIAFRADVLTTSRITNAILTFDGTTLQVVATGQDIAPGTGGKKYERAMSIVDLNANGDVLFGSTLLPTGSTAAAEPTIFLKPAGGAIVRIAGPGTASPGTGRTLTSANGVALSDTGQILFNGAISGGSGATGIFAWKTGVTRKILAQGDVNPLGGTFTDDMTTRTMRQSATGTVVFFAANSVWQNTEGGGTTVGIAAGSAAPAPVGGTFNGVLVAQAFGTSGDMIFSANISGGASSSAYFRFRPGSPVEAIVRLNESAPGAPGKSFTGFTAFSVNASGTVTFEGNQSGVVIGLYQKPAAGALTAFVLQGAATPAGGNLLLFGHPTQTLADGSVVFRVPLYNHATYYAIFRWSGSPTTLMTSGDDLPFGGRVVVRPTFVSASGDWVGISLQRAGGRETAAVLNVSTQQMHYVATEGDQLPGTNGGLLTFSNLTSGTGQQRRRCAHPAECLQRWRLLVALRTDGWRGGPSDGQSGARSGSGHGRARPGPAAGTRRGAAIPHHVCGHGRLQRAGERGTRCVRGVRGYRSGQGRRRRRRRLHGTGDHVHRRHARWHHGIRSGLVHRDNRLGIGPVSDDGRTGAAEDRRGWRSRTWRRHVLGLWHAAPE